MQEEGFRDLTPRLRTLPRPNPLDPPHLSRSLLANLGPEMRLQIQVIREFRAQLLERGVLLLSIGNELPARGRFVAAWQTIRAAAGAMAGAPDLVLIWADGGGFVELKRPKDERQGSLLGVKSRAGQLSTNQVAFRELCKAKGIRWARCRSSEEFQNTLQDWGLLP